MHYTNGVSEPAVFRSVIDVVSQPQLVYSAQSLKLWCVDDLTLMWVNANETMNRIPEFGCTIHSHEGTAV